ncbi:SpoIIE family protein phosphatase [Mycolicibacterium sp. 018/SC-01/001]|uniref:SpoIIE family protein phosphatase n=1 Tax=Mycolicibacterium sp. 018/SC-01/001 TaxID=2592069 RepID=UPI001181429E|nr:SpoIIE family protein phosphatase [Mycolicibacterium sp. 018/SC-01/001]TRW81190.1 SpoIIE family protein phosphatase [Mycolicibacterium sp. 018/SC-01/001]
MSTRRELVAARDDATQLVRVIVGIGSDLDLGVTLRRIVTAAVELSGARYGVLGIRGSDGTTPTFVCAGIEDGAHDDVFRRLALMTVGDGLRLDDLNRQHRYLDLRLSAEPLRALLAVPIMVREKHFGTLYLLHDEPGREFSDLQDVAVRAMATAAASAIDNARLFEREREAAKWTKASREITTALLSGDPQTGPLQLIVDLALDLADAEQAILLVPSEPDLPADHVATLVVAATAGRYAAEVIGRQVPMDGSTTGGVARRGLPLITDSFQYPIEGFTDVGERSAIVMPLIADDTVLGVIAVARRPHQPPFGNDYLELVSDFARHAAIALALAASREHALNRELAQAETVDAALRAAVDELRRLWRARRVIAVVFPDEPEDTPQVVVGGESTRWSELASEVRDQVGDVRRGELLTPVMPEPGVAAVAIQHPDGVLVVRIELSGARPFTLEDQTLLTVLAGRLSQGLHRIHQVDQQRETALALQHAILGPARLPQGFAVRYQAASRPLQVGGDWYDVVGLDDGRIALIVGDCVGHGLTAATIMGQVRSACRALLFDNPSPAAALSRLDRFAVRLPGAQCTTAVCVILDPATGELVYSSAGHPPPVLVHADGSVDVLDGGHAIALGIRTDRPRPEARAVVPAGATLMLYTDGLVERRGATLDDGLLRAVNVVREHRVRALDELVDSVMTELTPQGGYHDDVVMLLYRPTIPLERTFPAHAEQLAPTRSALRDWLERAGVGPHQVVDILVATGEAVANAIEHGHRDDPGGTVALRASASEDRITVTITDSGAWKVPDELPDPVRGRGVALMRLLMDEITVDHRDSGTTVELSARVL